MAECVQFGKDVAQSISDAVPIGPSPVYESEIGTYRSHYVLPGSIRFDFELVLWISREYPQLSGREEVVRDRIEELCKEGMQRHSSLAVDSRAQIHLQMACLVQASYKTLLPWLGNDQEKVIELIRKPVGESVAEPLGFAQRFVLFLHLNKFKFVSNSLKLMEADFGRAFSLSHHVSPGIHKARVNRCLYHSVFAAEELPELTPIFCALDRMWFDQLRPEKHGVEFLRPTLAKGDAACEFIVKRAYLKKDLKQNSSADGVLTILDKHRT